METLNVIWLASYPKSGNTWINSVIRQASLQKGCISGEIDVHILLREQKKPKICSAVRSNYSTLPCCVLKTHFIYDKINEPHIFKDCKLVNVGFIHIFRNPLDVLLSYINFTRLQYKNVVRNNPSGQRLANYQKSLFIETLGFGSFYDVDDWEKMDLAKIPQKNLDHAFFYNKMQAYYFCDYFSRSAITRFYKRHENTLKNFGYEFLLDKI